MSVFVLHGDVLEKLRSIADETFDVVITSPPYWGLRDYGVQGQLGLEPTLGEHLSVMVEVFAEVYRVLKSTGTLWLNYGDCYAAHPNGRSAAETNELGSDDRFFQDKPFSTVGPIYDQSVPARTVGEMGSKHETHKSIQKSGRVVAGGYLKPKDLCMVPNRVAIALQEWGWWVRSEIIWAKPNPMPESVKDRPATSHEKIFLLSKSAKYFYNNEAVRVDAKYSGLKGQEENGFKNPQNFNGKHKCGYRSGAPKKQRGHRRAHSGFQQDWDSRSKADQQSNGRNLRNYEPAPMQVWKIATRAFKGAHFATFPPELVERCLLASCPDGGHVLDPFGGAGTTALVADRRQIDCTLIEINEEYVELIKARLKSDQGPLLSVIEDQSTTDIPLLEGFDA